MVREGEQAGNVSFLQPSGRDVVFTSLLFLTRTLKVMIYIIIYFIPKRLFISNRISH